MTVSSHRWYVYMFENVHRKVKLIKYPLPQADPSSDPLIAITNIEVRILRDLHNWPDDHPPLPFPGEHPAWEGGGDHRLPGRRGQPLHHGAAQALSPRELVRLSQVRPLPLGLHLHWLLVQHDDPGHPVLGGPLHLAPPVQEQPGVSGRDCGLREHPDEWNQGQGHVGHSHEQGFSKERRVGFLFQCPMFISKLKAPKASSMFRRQPVNTWIILSVHSCSSTWGKLSYCQSKKLADYESCFQHTQMSTQPDQSLDSSCKNTIALCLFVPFIWISISLGVVSQPSRFISCLSFLS